MTRLILAACALVILIVCPIAGAGVRIEKAKPQVETRRFDPHNLPDPAPPVEHDEAAVCVYEYTLGVQTSYYLSGNRGSPTGQMTIRDLELTLGCKIVIWLPNNANAQLTAHEEGHRQIAEAFYKDADAIARKLGKTLEGRKLPINGTGEQAAKPVLAEAIKKLSDDYVAALRDPCRKAQDQYDELTDHGKKMRPPSEDAVKAVLQKKQ